LIYQSIIGNSNHKFKTGLSLNSDHYNEDFNVTNYKRTETVPGAFFEYTFNNNKKFSAIAGIRADHDNLYGWFATPRLHLRYEPFKGTTLRFGAGRGQRTADIFAENTSVFVSARQVNIIPSFNGGAYGLKPEIAWNEGISMDQKFNLFNRGANLGIDFFRTDFQQQVVVDLENAHQVNFYNLAGKSYSNSFQVEANMEPIKEVDVKLAYRYFDVKTTYDGKLLEKPLISANRAFVNLGYRVKKFRFDYTVSYNGKKRIPNTSALPIPYQLPAYSPGYYVMNAQVTRTFGKKNLFDVYLGSENLTNYFQKTVILSAENPFSNNFDASLVWGPVSGRMFYLGVRYKV
jgi:outer membrane receptor for ferrienterochelin and colicin